MLSFIKKAMVLNLLAVSLGAVWPAHAATWDWLMCVKKDGSSRYAEWNYYSPTEGMILLNAHSKTAHKSIGGYTWLSIVQPRGAGVSYLTDGNQPIVLDGETAETGCKELIKSCQMLDRAYEYVGTPDRNPLAILRSDGEGSREKMTVCPYFRPQN